MSILVALLALTLMITVHEWGHFIAARIFNVPVYEFAIGMGPKLFQHKGKKETLFSIRAIPLGGFCSFDSEDSLNDSAQNGVVDAALDKLPVYQRIIICFAGPLMNFVFAFLLVLSMLLIAGNATPTTKIVDFTDISPAKKFLQVNDYVYSIDGTVVYNDPEALSIALDEGAAKDGIVDVTVLRGDEYYTYEIKPEFDDVTNGYYIGIYQGSEYSSLSITKAFPKTFETIWLFISSVFTSLGGLLTGQYKLNEMSGIVGTIAFMGDYVKTSTIVPFITLVSLISVNLGVMNLLPIPALDGSKILFAIIEALRGKPLNKQIEIKMTLIGFALLIGLSVVLIFSDIAKLL